MSYLWYLLGYEELPEPNEKTIKQRHLVMKQIRNSKLKLKPVEKKQTLKSDTKEQLWKRVSAKRWRKVSDVGRV